MQGRFDRALLRAAGKKRAGQGVVLPAFSPGLKTNDKTGTSMDAEITRLTRQAQEYAGTLAQLRTEMNTVIVGQREVIDRLLVALCADGHVLLEGVPGIAKTLTIKTLSQCIDCSFVRIQFTPDLFRPILWGQRSTTRRTRHFPR